MKKRILILGKLPPPYMGPAIATQIILNSDLKNKFDLIHLDTRINRSLTTIGKISVKKGFTNISIYLKLRRIIKEKNPNLLLIPISQSTLGFFKDSIFILISRIYRKKVLLHLRGSNIQNWLKKSFVLFRIYAEWIIRRCQGAIVLGNNLKYLFERYFRDGKIFVVPNGTDYNMPKSLKNLSKKTKILYLSNLQASKGIIDIIGAVKILKEREGESFTLDVIGAWRDEKVKNKCLSDVSNFGLPVTFHQVKTSDEKFRFLVNSDIFIFPPREPEGHPWVIVEAMAAGLPIISTDQGAITESVINGENGFIVEKKNPEQIAEKIEFLIKNPDIRKKMGKKSRELYRKKFTEEKMVERLTQAFNSVINN